MPPPPAMQAGRVRSRALLFTHRARGCGRPARADFGMQTLDVMKKLVDAKAPLNARDYSGCAPLHIAARRGYPRAVTILLEGGCDMAVEDERAWRALHFACSTGHVEVARILIDKGADANALGCNAGGSLTAQHASLQFWPHVPENGLNSANVSLISSDVVLLLATREQW